eukprot:COSAG06_NODE_6464_length_2923_cov_1.470255_2_plen_551_part_00
MSAAAAAAPSLDGAALAVASRAVDNPAILERIIAHGGLPLVSSAASVSKAFHCATKGVQVWDSLRLRLPPEHRRSRWPLAVDARELYRQCWEDSRWSAGQLQPCRAVDVQVEGDAAHGRTRLPYRVWSGALCGGLAFTGANDGRVRGFSLSGKLERSLACDGGALALDSSADRWLVSLSAAKVDKRSGALVKLWDVERSAEEPRPCGEATIAARSKFVKQFTNSSPDHQRGSSLKLFRPAAQGQPPTVLVGSRDNRRFVYMTMGPDGSARAVTDAFVPEGPLAATDQDPICLGTTSLDDPNVAFFSQRHSSVLRCDRREPPLSAMPAQESLWQPAGAEVHAGSVDASQQGWNHPPGRNSAIQLEFLVADSWNIIVRQHMPTSSRAIYASLTYCHRVLTLRRCVWLHCVLYCTALHCAALCCAAQGASSHSLIAWDTRKPGAPLSRTDVMSETFEKDQKHRSIKGLHLSSRGRLVVTTRCWYSGNLGQLSLWDAAKSLAARGEPVAERIRPPKPHQTRSLLFAGVLGRQTVAAVTATGHVMSWRVGTATPQ